MLMNNRDDAYPTILHSLIHDTEHPAFRAWTWVINVLIYMSCVAIALESIEVVRAEYHEELAAFEWFSVVFFTLDYLFNIYTAKNKLGYMTSFWGVVDLLSILPSYLMLFNFSSVRATKILRLLRVIRILRVLKLARSAMNDVNAARDGKTNRIAANLRIYFIALFSVLMISSTLMFYVEGSLYTPEAIAEGQMHMEAVAAAKGEPVGAAKFIPSDPLTGAAIPEEKRFFTSIPETMWWCIVTLTTTGYGDLYPVTMGGRIIAGVTMLMGLVLFGMLMNIVGKTLMVMLFGEPVGHESDEKLKTPEEKIGAAFDLLADAGVISHQSAYMLRDIPSDELSERLEGNRIAV
jgi:voltage-gated potassium channel